jgi:hypothetical protein
MYNLTELSCIHSLSEYVPINQTVIPKDQGGLGVLNLDIMNIALLSKWLWKLFNSSGLWQTIIKKKYLGDSTLRQVTYRNGDSHFWQGLLEGKSLFLSCCKFQTGDGRSVSF